MLHTAFNLTCWQPLLDLGKTRLSERLPFKHGDPYASFGTAGKLVFTCFASRVHDLCVFESSCVFDKNSNMDDDLLIVRSLFVLCAMFIINQQSLIIYLMERGANQVRSRLVL